MVTRPPRVGLKEGPSVLQEPYLNSTLGFSKLSEIFHLAGRVVLQNGGVKPGISK